MDDLIRGERLARNEDAFRRVNERLHALATIAGEADTYERFVCECADPACSVVVELTPDEYRAVRDDRARFIVYPSVSHFDPTIEVVVERRDRLWVVEKYGEAGDEAEKLADDGSPLL